MGCLAMFDTVQYPLFQHLFTAKCKHAHAEADCAVSNQASSQNGMSGWMGFTCCKKEKDKETGYD